MLREAAIKPEVKAIKTTLYRLAKDSKVVKALITAARNGKKVTAVVELLARFDEESNIKWSKRMQEEGVNVIFGVEGLKIHSKLLYIESKKGNIACVGTGNFHEGNAKIYTDYLMMTARTKLVNEVAKVFDFIDRPFSPFRFNELLVSPNSMKSRILRMLDTEIKNANEGKEAWVKMKINHITDTDMVTKLYQASKAGVKIDIVIRGNSFAGLQASPSSATTSAAWASSTAIWSTAVSSSLPTEASQDTSSVLPTGCQETSSTASRYSPRYMTRICRQTCSAPSPMV